MNFKQMAASVLGPSVTLAPGADFEVTQITQDSREVTPGSVFFALKGKDRDGRDFVADAAAKGAKAVICDAPLSGLSIPVIQIPEARRIYALMCREFYAHPSKGMKLVGVTGTNGKTTSATLLHHWYQSLGKSGLFSTIETVWGHEALVSTHTTPDAAFLYRTLGRMKEAGCRTAVIECSSHALDQERLAGLEFHRALFTNLTQDHLDYHRDMDTYLAAKARLFTMLGAKGIAVLNRDDASFEVLKAGIRMPIVSYGLSPEADIRAEIQEESSRGTSFMITGPNIRQMMKTSLIGRHNVYNLLGVMALVLSEGAPPETAAKTLGAFEGVPGRLERIEGGQDFDLFVDYAHTPDGLEKVLKALKPHVKRKLWVMFGCGGQRDTTKRPLMARIAERLADGVMITSDNPRTENPRDIIRDVVKGFSPHYQGYEVQIDRAKAIRTILLKARSGDIVVLAGKGHETVQIIGTEKIPFSDSNEAMKVLKGY